MQHDLLSFVVVNLLFTALRSMS